MHFTLSSRILAAISAVFVVPALLTAVAEAQVKDVVVGITTTCPYENAIEGSCWSGAYWALVQLDGVKAADKSANGYNCTARIYLADNVSPDPGKWAEQFKKIVGKTYVFRGVEVTVRGTVDGDGNGLIARIPGLNKAVKLQPFTHKLQWNFKKKAPRQPEADESNAYRDLLARKRDNRAGILGDMELTGPFTMTDKEYVIEVREYIQRGSGEASSSAK